MWGWRLCASSEPEDGCQSRAAARLSALTLLGVLGACSSDAAVPAAESAGTSTADQLVCGLLDRDLLRRVVGDAEIDTRGPGFRDRAERAVEPANCTVQDLDRGQTFLQVSIGEVDDPSGWRRKLEQEASGSYGDCTRRYDGEPGHGYGCTYDSRVFAAGAGVHVIRDGRLIRVTVHHWPDASPQDRLALAEEIADDLHRNVSAREE